MYFLIIAWMLGGYVGATALSLMMGGPRSSRLREVILRLAMLAGYAAVSGLLSAAIIGPGLGIVPGYSTWLAACGTLLVFAAGAATAGLQAALGLPGTLIAIVGMVVFGNPTAGTSIAAPLLASPWDVLGQLLPPGAALSLARNIVYHVDVDITRPLVVLSAYALAGVLIMAGAALIRQRKAAARAAVPAATA